MMEMDKSSKEAQLTKSSPAKFTWMPWMTNVAISLGTKLLFGGKKKKSGIGSGTSAELTEAMKRFDERMKEYEKSEFQPLDPRDYQQENVFEEMEVDTTAADYAARQFRQSQQNILTGLRGAAGASGVSSLAQALSNQAQQQAERGRVTIAQQAAQNRRLSLMEERRINDQERQIQLANAQGAKQFEREKLATLLGVEAQKISGIRQSIANRQAMYGQIAGGVGGMFGELASDIAGEVDWGELFGQGGDGGGGNS